MNHAGGMDGEIKAYESADGWFHARLQKDVRILRISSTGSK